MLWMVCEWPPFRWLRFCLFWVLRPRLLRLRIADAAELRRSRLELASLDERLCRDIGLTADEASRRARVPLGDELSAWASPELRNAVAESRQISGPSRWYQSGHRSRIRG